VQKWQLVLSASTSVVPSPDHEMPSSEAYDPILDEFGTSDRSINRLAVKAQINTKARSMERFVATSMRLAQTLTAP
jgi:hypothetical protein